MSLEGPKWLQNWPKCMPQALQKRPLKNDQKIITTVPPKWHPKRPKAVTTGSRTHFLDPSGLKLGLQMGPKSGPAFLEKCRATLRSGRRNARSDWIIISLRYWSTAADHPTNILKKKEIQKFQSAKILSVYLYAQKLVGCHVTFGSLHCCKT